MNVSKVFVARLANTPVFDADGDRVGKLRDIIVSYRARHAPHVNGLLVDPAGPARKPFFIGMRKVASIGTSQLIVGGETDTRPFQQRGEEVRVLAELLDRTVHLRDGSGDGVIEDVAIELDDAGDWSIGQLFLRLPKTSKSPFGKAPARYVGWDEAHLEPDAEDDTPATAFLTAHSEMEPSDLANALLELPRERMFEVAAELPDERLADVLEEMYEEDQIRIIERLGDERAADVLDRMQPDDAADLVAKLDNERSEALLGLMEPDEAQDVRMLLTFEPDTAGGLMTTDPIIVSADATVAEALVLIRRKEVAPALATCVFVTASPYEPPTGRYLGLVHFQRLLRYPPHDRVGSILDKRIEPVHTTTQDIDVVRALARYDLVVLPVVDDARRLVGVITVDDVLDHILPKDWRTPNDDDSTPARRAATATRTRTAAAGRRRNHGNG